MNQELYVYTATGKSLNDVLAEFAKTLPDAGAVALLYTPNWCGFARLVKGNPALQVHPKEVVNLDGVYEARVFHKRAELRWLKDPSRGAHRTVLLASQKYDVGLEPKPPERLLEDPPSCQYLLWGKGTGHQPANNGWSELATARIGCLNVPLSGVGKDQRVLLCGIEYLAECDGHGNVAVVEERLTGLEVDNGHGETDRNREG